MEVMEAMRVVTVDSRVAGLIWVGAEATVEVISRGSLMRITVEAWEDMEARDSATGQASQEVAEAGPMVEAMEEVTEEAMGEDMVEAL